jgi:hypothetical protein
MRHPALRITCQECGSQMMPNESDWIKCTGYGKAMSAGDRTKAVRAIPLEQP